MEYRSLLRPLPLILIVLFVAVAVGDLVQNLGQEQLPPPGISGAGPPSFVALEPVIDLRADHEDSAVEIGPRPALVPDQWSKPGRRGVWAMGAVVHLELELAAGAHRVLVLECRPAGGKRPVRSLRLKINGVDSGEVTLEPGWSRYRIVLPEGAVGPGRNHVVFSFPDREVTQRLSRALLIRRFGWFFDRDTGIGAIDADRPVTVDFDSERVTLRRSGTLDVPFVLDDRTDALQMRYRLPSGGGRAEIEVRSLNAGAGADDGMQQQVAGERQISGRVRFPLHGRRGEFALRIRARLPSPDDRLLISSLRLVEEGDPTRRPWAANRSRNRGQDSRRHRE
jgi:hypothetical protein